MRILVYGINYAPELTGVGKYTAEMCEWLAGRGHEVKVVCAPPYYPAWRVSDGYSAAGYSREILNGVTVLRCPLWVPDRQTGFRRILHLLSFAVSSFPVVTRIALTWRPQIVFVLEPPFFCTPAALFAARLSGAVSWLHIQDLEIDAAFALGMIRSSLLKRVVNRAELSVMKMFDQVSTVSGSMLDRIRKKGVKSEMSKVFPNWVDSGSIYPLEGGGSLRREWGIDRDSVVILYSGNMGEKQGLETVIETAGMVSDDKRIQFVLSGDGTARQRLEKSAIGLGNIRFTPLQPLERLNYLLNLADIHILPQRPDMDSLVMPSKLLGMLASGRPVVAAAEADSELADVVNRCGVVVAPGDARAFSGELRRLADDAGLRNNLGGVGRRLCMEQWGRENVLAEFEGRLTALLGGGSGKQC